MAAKSVVVTGASTGIGEACALRFHERGWRVFAGVRRHEDGDALSAQTSPRLTPMLLDVTVERAIDEAQTTVAEAVGEDGLQGLVNNAGIGVGGPVEGLDLSALRHQFEVNVFGQVAVSQAFLPLLRAGGGRIVNMSFDRRQGRRSRSWHRTARRSTRSRRSPTRCARSLTPWGIHVAAVEPGVIATPIWDKAREPGRRDVREDASPRDRRLYGKATERLRASPGQVCPLRAFPPKVADAVEHAMHRRLGRARAIRSAATRGRRSACAGC